MRHSLGAPVGPVGMNGIPIAATIGNNEPCMNKNGLHEITLDCIGLLNGHFPPGIHSKLNWENLSEQHFLVSVMFLKSLNANHVAVTSLDFDSWIDHPIIQHCSH